MVASVGVPDNLGLLGVADVEVHQPFQTQTVEFHFIFKGDRYILVNGMNR